MNWPFFPGPGITWNMTLVSQHYVCNKEQLKNPINTQEYYTYVRSGSGCVKLTTVLAGAPPLGRFEPFG